MYKIYRAYQKIGRRILTRLFTVTQLCFSLCGFKGQWGTLWCLQGGRKNKSEKYGAS